MMKCMSQTEGLPFFAHCPHCLHPYAKQDARLLDRSDRATTYHLSCSSCLHAMLFSVHLKEGGMLCSGAFTDCSFEDALRFKRTGVVSVDDVLSAHLALQLDNFMEIR